MIFGEQNYLKKGMNINVSYDTCLGFYESEIWFQIKVSS